MKKYFILLFCLLTCTLSANCSWFTGYYISIFGGCSQKGVNRHKYEEFSVKTTYKPGYIVSGSIGSRYGPFRLEGEFGYSKSVLKNLKIEEWKIKLKGNLRTITGMANLYYDFNHWRIPFIPYIGIGLGYGNTKMSHDQEQAASFNGNDKGLAWQAMLGVSCPIRCNVDLFVEYRYLDTHLDKDINYTIGGGLRYWF